MTAFILWRDALSGLGWALLGFLSWCGALLALRVIGDLLRPRATFTLTLGVGSTGFIEPGMWLTVHDDDERIADAWFKVLEVNHATGTVTCLKPGRWSR